MAVEDIVVAVDAQYVEELKEDYVSYKNQTINTMIEQLQTCYVITKSIRLPSRHTSLSHGATCLAHVPQPSTINWTGAKSNGGTMGSQSPWLTRWATSCPKCMPATFLKQKIR